MIIILGFWTKFHDYQASIHLTPQPNPSSQVSSRLQVLNIALLASLIIGNSIWEIENIPSVFHYWGGFAIISLLAVAALPGLRQWHDTHRLWWLLPLIAAVIPQMPALLFLQISTFASNVVLGLTIFLALLLIIPLNGGDTTGWRASAVRFWAPAAVYWLILAGLRTNHAAIQTANSADQFVFYQFSLTLVISLLWIILMLANTGKVSRPHLRCLAAAAFLCFISNIHAYAFIMFNDYESMLGLEVIAILYLPFTLIEVLHSSDLLAMLQSQSTDEAYIELRSTPITDTFSNLSNSAIGKTIFSMPNVIVLSIYALIALVFMTRRIRLSARLIIAISLMAIAMPLCAKFDFFYYNFHPSQMLDGWLDKSRLMCILIGMGAVSISILTILPQPIIPFRLWPEFQVLFRWSLLLVSFSLLISWLIFGITYYRLIASIKHYNERHKSPPSSELDILFAQTFFQLSPSIQKLQNAYTTQWTKSSSGLGISTPEQAAIARKEFDENIELMKTTFHIARNADSISMHHATAFESYKYVNYRHMNQRVVARFLSGQAEARLVDGDWATAIECTSAVLRLASISMGEDCTVIDNLIGNALSNIAQTSMTDILARVDATTDTLTRRQALASLNRSFDFPRGFSPLFRDAYSPIRFMFAVTTAQNHFDTRTSLNANTTLDRSYESLKNYLWLRAMIRLRLFREHTGRFPHTVDELIAHFPRQTEDKAADFLTATWWDYFNLEFISNDRIRVAWILPDTHTMVTRILARDKIQLDWTSSGYHATPIAVPFGATAGFGSPIPGYGAPAPGFGAPQQSTPPASTPAPARSRYY